MVDPPRLTAGGLLPGMGTEPWRSHMSLGKGVVRMSEEIKLVDTTIRDGHQSLWACRMRAEAMLPAMPDLDGAGFDSIEFTVPSSQFSRAVRDLRENPWDWLRLGAARAHDTPLRLHGNATSPFIKVPRSVEELLLEKLVGLGIKTTRISDPWNDFTQLSDRLALFATHDMAVVVNVIYSESPRHTLEHFAAKTREAAWLRPYRICFKDVGGLLTPETAKRIFPVIVDNADGIPLEFHGHCSNGFAPYVVLMAAEAGIHIIHTAVPPLADDWSLPSVFSVARNLRARGFCVNVDTDPLERVMAHFMRVAHIEGMPVGMPRVYDESLYRHQVPGGMISNLRFQLGQLGLEHRLPEALDEAATVRKDFGYPIMVTPLSQFVGSQAALNVISGSRYGSVTDEVIEYALGRWGPEAVAQMDPDVRQRILDGPRAAEIEARGATTEASLDDVRSGFPKGTSDEDMILRVVSGVGKEPLDLKPGPKPDFSYEDYRNAHGGVIAMVERVAQDSNVKALDYSDSRSEVSIRRA